MNKESIINDLIVIFSLFPILFIFNLVIKIFEKNFEILVLFSLIISIVLIICYSKLTEKKEVK